MIYDDIDIGGHQVAQMQRVVKIIEKLLEQHSLLGGAYLSDDVITYLEGYVNCWHGVIAALNKDKKED